MRVFVAFGVPPTVTDRLAEAVAPFHERFPDLNWTPPASWHVTLAFVGELDDDRVEEVRSAVEDAVGAVGTGEVGLALGAPGRFGSRVAWVGVGDRPRGAVADLGAELQRRLLAGGLPVDRKEVRPHLTLVRARGRRGQLPSGLVDELPAIAATWTVRTATVYRSHLGPGPVEYEPLAEVPLG